MNSRNIVYYVACSLDGYICGPGGDISGFVADGSGVDRYLADISAYDTVIMGRRTYEFGYQFGLEPGQPSYPHMQHYIFSGSLRFDKADARVQVMPLTLGTIEQIQSEPGTDIYLCGGGQLAGWLLDHGKIDRLILKLNPLILGGGVRLFGDSVSTCKCRLLDAERFDEGLQILSYQITY